MMKTIFAFTLLLFAHSAAAITVDEVVQSSSMHTNQSRNNRFWLDLSLPVNFNFSHYGLTAGAGYRFSFLGVDLRANVGKTNFGNITIKPDDPSELDEIDPESQMARPRADNDSWSFYSFNPGISVSGRLLPEILPRFSERARIGIDFGSATDQINSLSFSSVLFTIESTILYQIEENSPWAATLSIFWNSGDLIADEPKDSPTSFRRLPVSWMGLAAGVSYFFEVF